MPIKIKNLETREVNKVGISVFIITKNEEERIKDAIESVVDIADEIVIVDSGSEDTTKKIAKSFKKVRWYFNEWPGYGKQKKYAESLCKNNLVFNIDADERATEKLCTELLKVAKNTNRKFDAYKIDVKIKSRFSNITPMFGPKDRVIRFYDKKKCSYSDHPIHDSVIVIDCEVGVLKNHLTHECFKSYKHAVEKINGYTEMQAMDLFQKGRNPSTLRIIFEPSMAFWKAYILNKYIFLGLEGFIEACIYSFSRTLRLAKTKEKFIKESQQK